MQDIKKQNIKIEIKNMNLYYGDFHALKDVELALPEKQITAFIGPSGCGKSTLLKSLNRMNGFSLYGSEWKRKQRRIWRLSENRRPLQKLDSE